MKIEDKYGDKAYFDFWTHGVYVRTKTKYKLDEVQLELNDVKRLIKKLKQWVRENDEDSWL